MKRTLFTPVCLCITASFAMAATNAPPRELLKHVASASVQTHSVKQTATSARKQFVTTQLVEDANGQLTLVLDQSAHITLVPSQDQESTWEGLYADPEVGREPGVVVERSYDGGGNLITAVTVGWDNPVQIVLQQQNNAALALVEKKKECKCTYVSFICTKALCDDGGLCIGATEDTCFMGAMLQVGLPSWQNLAPENDVIQAVLLQ